MSRPSERRPAGPTQHAVQMLSFLRGYAPDVEWDSVEDEVTDMMWGCFEDAQRLFEASMLRGTGKANGGAK